MVYSCEVTIYYGENGTKKTKKSFTANHEDVARDKASTYAEQVRKTGFVIHRTNGGEVHYPVHQVNKIIVSQEEEITRREKNESM